MTDEARMECPASMCPLIAPNGSPWSGSFAASCPGRGLSEDPNDREGCPWWDMACSCGGIQAQVEEAAEQGGAVLVVGPNQPGRLAGNPRHYDCPRASVYRWQEQAEVAGRKLCPPRDALERGLDPRVCLF
jgi:hypothetical protein